MANISEKTMEARPRLLGREDRNTEEDVVILIIIYIMRIWK